MVHKDFGTSKYYNEVWTNTAYALGACFVMSQGHIAVGLALMFLAFASFYGHATGHFPIDWVGMFTAYGALNAHFSAELLPAWNLSAWAVWVFIVVMAVTFYPELKKIKTRLPLKLHYILIGSFFIIALIQSCFVVDIEIALFAGVMHLIGFIVRQKISHSMWHILTAIGYTSFFLP